MKPVRVNLEDYLYGDHKDYKSMEEIYKQFINSAQNFNMLPKVIKFETRNEEMADILHHYNIQDLSAEDPEKLFEQFNQKYHIVVGKNTGKLWKLWCRSVVDSARFLCRFDSPEEFDKYVKSFDDVSRRKLLPKEIAKNICNIKFAAACDLIKELGYTEYIKPDIHMDKIFTAFGLCPECDKNKLHTEKRKEVVFDAGVNMAYECQKEDPGITPYKVDKVLWMICSGRFYKEKPEIDVPGQRDEFIQYAKDKIKHDFKL